MLGQRKFKTNCKIKLINLLKKIRKKPKVPTEGKIESIDKLEKGKQKRKILNEIFTLSQLAVNKKKELPQIKY